MSRIFQKNGKNVKKKGYISTKINHIKDRYLRTVG